LGGSQGGGQRTRIALIVVPAGTGLQDRGSRFVKRRNSMGELTDKIKGNVNEAIGKAKQHSNDADTKAEGAAQELKGKAQQVAGTVKGALGDKI
jgi:uncharacterized protein YjbJ (UPF0337 family)